MIKSSYSFEISHGTAGTKEWDIFSDHTRISMNYPNTLKLKAEIKIYLRQKKRKLC